MRAPGTSQRAYLFGQAPGVVEGEERLPWRGPRRPDAPPLARARGGRVLRDLLLRLGHALLPGSRAVGPRRPDADAARAGALLLLAGLGARAAATAPDRHGRRAGAAAAARAPVAHAVRRRALSSCRERPSSRSPTRPARAAGSTTPRTAGGWPGRPPSSARSSRASRGSDSVATFKGMSAVPYRRTFARLLSFLRPYKRGLVRLDRARGRLAGGADRAHLGDGPRT